MLLQLLHDHCLCSVGDSCDRCRTVHPVAFATKAEVDSLLQRVLDLEVRLKTENKSLRLQVLALEECNDHLESKIAILKSKTNNKAKPSNINNKGHVKGAPSKNSLPLPAKSLPHSSTTVPPTHLGNPTSNPQATEHAVAQSIFPPKSFRIVWGIQWRCTPEVLLKAISPMLPREDSKSVVVKKSYRRLNGKSKWCMVYHNCPSQHLVYH